MTEDLIIRIKQELEGKGLKDLKNDLSLVQKEMDVLVSKGQRNTQSYRDLNNVAGTLAGKIKVLKSEYAGYTVELDKNTKKIATDQKNAITQQIKDAELQRRTQQRLYDEMFKQSSDKPLSGKSTNIGEIGSKQYFSEMKKGYTELMNSVSQTNLKFAEYKAKVDQANTALKSFNTTKKMTTMQMLEFGENLTAVGYGLYVIISQVGRLTGEMLKLGGNLMTVEKAFNKFTGENSFENLSLLRVASAGNMTDEAIMKYANRYLQLKFSIEQVAQVLDFTERAADDFGISMNEATEKILKFFQTGKGRGFEQLGVDINKVNNEAIRLAGGTQELLDKMDTEDQALIRTRAFLNLYGDSVENIRNKQKGLDDKIVSTSTNWENAKARIGEYLAMGLTPLLNIMDFAINIVRNFGHIIESLTGGFVDFEIILRAMFSPFNTIIVLWETIVKIWVKAVKIITGIHESFTGMRNQLQGISSALSSTPSMQFLKSIADVVLWVNDKITDLLKLLNLIPGVNIEIPKEAKGATSTYKEAKGGIIPTKTDTKGGSSSTTKDEVDKFRELLDMIRTQADLYAITNGLEGKSYEILLKELELNKALADTDEKRVEYYQQVLNLTEKINKIFSDRLRQSAESLKNSGIITEDNTAISEREKIKTTTTQGEKIGKQFENYLYLSEKMNNVFRDMMSTLKINANSFIGQLANGFDYVLGLLKTAQGVWDIVKIGASFIPGGSAAVGALGGMQSGNMSKMISDYSRYQMGRTQANNISIVVESEVERTKAIKFFDNNFNNYRKYARQSTF